MLGDPPGNESLQAKSRVISCSNLSQGGRFFEDSSVAVSGIASGRMEDGQLDPILATEDDDGFRPLKTVPAFR